MECDLCGTQSDESIVMGFSNGNATFRCFDVYACARRVKSDGGLKTPAQVARERDPLDELCEAIAKFGDAQFSLGNSKPPTMLASLDQAKTAHDALWRVITRILTAAAEEIAQRPKAATAEEIEELRKTALGWFSTYTFQEERTNAVVAINRLADLATNSHA